MVYMEEEILFQEKVLIVKENFKLNKKLLYFKTNIE
jgi:hypothetical protein